VPPSGQMSVWECGAWEKKNSGSVGSAIPFRRGGAASIRPGVRVGAPSVEGTRGYPALRATKWKDETRADLPPFDRSGDGKGRPDSFSGCE